MSSSTNILLFFANYAFYPYISFGAPRPVATGSSQYIRNQYKDGIEFVRKINNIFDVLYENLIMSQSKQEKHTNANQQPHLVYKPKDEVYLDSKNITSARLVKKLNNKFYGPYQIEKVLDSYSYKLKLLDEFGRTYRTFHPSLLMPANQPGLPGCRNNVNSPVRTSVIGLLQHLRLLYFPSELDITKYIHNEFTHHLIAIKPQTL
jgi:hypothetical protein